MKIFLVTLWVFSSVYRPHAYVPSVSEMPSMEACDAVAAAINEMANTGNRPLVRCVRVPQ